MDKSKTYPILMVRTPYSARPYGSSSFSGRLGPSAIFEKEGSKLNVLNEMRILCYIPMISENY